MGKTARDASDTYTVREWAAKIATRAGPRDYVGQLRALYDEICDRWRYVQEPDEWIHGTAKSLLAHVLGLKYSAPNEDPTRVDLARVDSTNGRGWGDCDDVTTLVAAAARALGMTPFFRVTVANGGAHVSTMVKTPNGKMISVDPVGHPHREFGWKYDDGESFLFDIDGKQVASADTGQTDMITDFSGFDGVPQSQCNCPHYAAVSNGDVAGPRCLAVPMRAAKLMRSGVVLNGTPAIDENGRQYYYDAHRDLWIDKSLARTNLGKKTPAFGGIKSRRKRRAKRKERRAARRKRVARRVKRLAKRVVNVGKKVGKFYRRVGSKVLQNPAIRATVSAAGSAVGIPPMVTNAAMKVGGKFMESGGIAALVRNNPKLAAQVVARRAKTFSGLRRGYQGTEERGIYEMEQGGRRFPCAPIMAIAGVPGLFMGELDLTPTPKPGSWYRIQKGDTLFGITSKAFGVGAGSQRLKLARMINRAKANGVYRDSSNTSNGLFPEGLISFSKKWAEVPDSAIKGASGSSYAVIWIPETEGDEPPVKTEIIPSDTVPDEPETPILPDPGPTGPLFPSFPPENQTPIEPPKEPEGEDEDDIFFPDEPKNQTPIEPQTPELPSVDDDEELEDPPEIKPEPERPKVDKPPIEVSPDTTQPPIKIPPKTTEPPIIVKPKQPDVEPPEKDIDLISPDPSSKIFGIDKKYAMLGLGMGLLYWMNKKR